MANRRMFSRDVCESDAFLDLPATSQRLYFFMGLYADDEGFLKNPRSVMRMVGAVADDLNILIAKQFVISFDSGVIVIRHWKIHNYIQKDRFTPTTCVSEKAFLTVDSAKAYRRVDRADGTCLPRIQPVDVVDTACIHSVRAGKERLGEDSEAEEVSPVIAFDGTDLTLDIANNDRADDLVLRYKLPDTDQSREALLEDAERLGWEALEDALQRAALSNSRPGLSVNFYRRFLGAPDSGAGTGGERVAIDNHF